MLQETVRRLDGLDQEHPRRAIGLVDPLVVCNEAHRFLVAEQFRLIGRQPAGIILEPKGRNTAPALTLAALAATRGGQDPVLLVMPADHTIRHEPAFRAAVADGFNLAEQGAVVTFGIVPSKPETGYGYIRQGAPPDGWPLPRAGRPRLPAQRLRREAGRGDRPGLSRQSRRLSVEQRHLRPQGVACGWP